MQSIRLQYTYTYLFAWNIGHCAASARAFLFICTWMNDDHFYFTYNGNIWPMAEQCPPSQQTRRVYVRDIPIITYLLNGMAQTITDCRRHISICRSGQMLPIYFEKRHIMINNIAGINEARVLVWPLLQICSPENRIVDLPMVKTPT